MFEFIRNHNRIIQIVLAMIAVPFAFWGIDSYVRGPDHSREIASVGGQPVTLNEFNQALQQQQDQMRQMFGRQYDADKFDTPETRLTLINGLVDRHLVANEAARGNLTLTDDDLRAYILSIPAFQDNGKFSPERYTQFIASQSRGKLEFESLVRGDRVLRQITDTIENTEIPSKTVISRWQQINEQEREISEVAFQPAQFLKQAQVTPEAIKQYYDANNKTFEAPQTVTADYLVLSLDTLGAQTQPTEDDLKAWYDAHWTQFVTPEQRQASHILIAAPKAASDADRAKAKAKAEGLLAQVKKNPASFADLAKKNSDDPGSAAKGGDLGFFNRGMMVKPFDDAVFAMKPGEISGIVESDFGYHIIKLTNVKAPEGKTLAQVHDQAEREVRKQLAQKKFAESAESFGNMVYEQSDSLQPAADKFKLQIQHTGEFSKRDAPAAVPLLNNQKLLDALFSDDAIKSKRNTEAVEVSPNTLVSARVVTSIPAHLRTLAEVEPTIRLILQTKEASLQAHARAAIAQKELSKGGDAATAANADLKWSAPKTVSRQAPLDLNPDEIKAVFAADVSKLPVYTVADAPEAAFVLYRISAVNQPQVFLADKRKKREDDLTASLTRGDFEGYLAALRAKSKVTINKEAVERKDR